MNDPTGNDSQHRVPDADEDRVPDADEEDVGQALDALRLEWGDAYVVAYDSGRWQAWRLVGDQTMIAAGTPDELDAALRADCPAGAACRGPAADECGEPMMVRGEPEYVDQVPRRMAYEAAHPNVEILYLGAYWQAIIREGEGQTIITRHSLKQLLNKLESM